MVRVLLATSASIEHAFAHHGVRISRVARPPEICYPEGCSAVELWGGRRTIYFKPRTGKDFVVILFSRSADAAKVAHFEANGGLGSARRGSLVLLYYKLSPRIAKLRAALAAAAA